MSKTQLRVAGKSVQGIAGGLAYGALEIFWRGYTHISMVLLGGICFLLLNRLSKSNRNLALLCLAGGVSITIMELIAGCILNVWLQLDIWDYSGQMMHLWGQICPKYFFAWSGLCLAVIPLCRYLNHKLVPLLSQSSAGAAEDVLQNL